MNEILVKDMEDIFSRNLQWEEFSGKTIFLTGAYGMLASYITYFCQYLHDEKGIDVTLICAVRSIEKFYSRFEDLQDREYIEVLEYTMDSPITYEERIDYIIHTASFASPQYYGVCPVDVLKPNILGTYYLLELAVAKKVKGFLMFSSSDIYGDLNKSYITEMDFGGMDTLDIHSCYSESKRMAETICKSYFVQYNIPVKIARIWHTYAPTMDYESDPRVFSSFVKNIIHNENIEMKSDGSGKRCFCYITDAVAGYFSVLLNGKSGEAYNVCNSSQYVSMKVLGETLVGLYPEKQLKVITKERDKSEHYVENEFMRNKERIPSDEKLRKLGWEPRVDIKEGFARVVRYLSV